MEVKDGIWTPWAKVVCFECHGPTFKNRDYDPDTHTWRDKSLTKEQWERAIVEMEMEEGNGVTFCDDCGESIQVDDSVAAEHNMVRRLKEAGIPAEMWQTGGMNSACTIPTTDKGYYMLTYNFDGDDTYSIWRYDEEDAPLNYEDHFESKNEDEAFEYLLERDDIQRT